MSWMNMMEREKGWRKAVDKYYWDLTEHINPDQVIRRLKTLLSRGNSDYNYQKVTLPNKTPQERCEELLDCLRRTENWWDPFIKALNVSGYGKYAAMLEDAFEEYVQSQNKSYTPQRRIKPETKLQQAQVSPSEDCLIQTHGLGSQPLSDRQHSSKRQLTLATPLKKVDYRVLDICADLDCTSIKGCYKHLAAELGLQWEDVTAIEQNFSRSQTHQVLELYGHISPEKATLGCLMQALHNIQREDVLLKICHLTQLSLPEKPPIPDASNQSNDVCPDTSEPDITRSHNSKVRLDFPRPDLKPPTNSQLQTKHAQKAESAVDESLNKQMESLAKATRLEEVKGVVTDEGSDTEEDSDTDEESSESGSEGFDTSVDDEESDEGREDLHLKEEITGSVEDLRKPEPLSEVITNPGLTGASQTPVYHPPQNCSAKVVVKVLPSADHVTSEEGEINSALIPKFEELLSSNPISNRASSQIGHTPNAVPQAVSNLSFARHDTQQTVPKTFSDSNESNNSFQYSYVASSQLHGQGHQSHDDIYVDSSTGPEYLPQVSDGPCRNDKHMSILGHACSLSEASENPSVCERLIEKVLAAQTDKSEGQHRYRSSVQETMGSSTDNQGYQYSQMEENLYVLDTRVNLPKMCDISISDDEEIQTFAVTGETTQDGEGTSQGSPLDGAAGPRDRKMFDASDPVLDGRPKSTPYLNVLRFLFPVWPSFN